MLLGRAGRSVSFATENQRKIVRDIVKHARRPVKARVIPPKIIQKYFKRIAELEPDVARILEEESAEKEIAKLENRANRMQNQLETVSVWLFPYLRKQYLQLYRKYCRFYNFNI